MRLHNADQPTQIVSGQTSDSIYICMTPNPVVFPLSWAALTLGSCRCGCVFDSRTKEMWSVLWVGKKPWAPWGRWLCFINFLNPMTSTITRPYCRHTINIVKWNWITGNSKWTRSLCLSGHSDWICPEVLAWIPSSRCLSGKEGHGLEVFAYKLIWRSARLNLSTEGKESDAFRLAFWTKQWSSLAVMECGKTEQQGRSQV